MSKDP
jgi:DNA replication licensing factor MCM5